MISYEYLNKIENFNLALKKNKGELDDGEHSTSSHGSGMVFSDHKPYSPGDEIRKIDWKAYARTKDYYIKRYEEEKSITLHVLVDRSSSMDYGKAENKFDYASKLGLSLSYMITNTNDRYRFSVFSETLTDISSARRNSNLADLIETLNSIGKTPESRIKTCVTEYSQRIKHESTIVIISDFLTDFEQIKNAIDSLKGSNAVLVNVLDASELDPDFEGDTLLKDPESSSKLRTYLTSKTKKRYRENLEEHLDCIEDYAEKNGLEFMQVSTGNDVLEDFLEVWNSINA